MSDEAKVYTPDDVHELMKQLAQVVVELGLVDWNELAQQDETPNVMSERVSTLVNGAGMLGSLAMAAQVPVMAIFDGMVAAAIQAAGDEG